MVHVAIVGKRIPLPRYTKIQIQLVTLKTRQQNKIKWSTPSKACKTTQNDCNRNELFCLDSPPHSQPTQNTSHVTWYPTSSTERGRQSRFHARKLFPAPRALELCNGGPTRRNDALLTRLSSVGRRYQIFLFCPISPKAYPNASDQ